MKNKNWNAVHLHFLNFNFLLVSSIPIKLALYGNQHQPDYPGPALRMVPRGYEACNEGLSRDGTAPGALSKMHATINLVPILIKQLEDTGRHGR